MSRSFRENVELVSRHINRLRAYPAVIEIMKIYYERDLGSFEVASFCVSTSDEVPEDMMVLPLDLFEGDNTVILVHDAHRTAARVAD